MAIADGSIQFDDNNGTTIDVPVPSFPYKTIIELPFEWQKQDDGTWEGYDHGDTYDKRSCECSFFYDVDDMETFNDFFRTDGEGRGQDVIMRMNSNSGFFPFGADKGDEGDFTVALIIKKHGMVGESPFRYFKFDVVIYNTGSWPAFTPPAEVDEGELTIGTVTDLRFPPDWFKPKAEYGEFATIEQDASSQWIDRSDNYDWYETGFNMVCNESKTAALIEYLVDTARVNSFTIEPPDDSYAFGRDNSATASYTVQLIQDTITITHTQNNRFTFPLNVAFVSSLPIADGNITWVETDDPGADTKKCAVDTANKLLFITLTAANLPLRSWSYNASGNMSAVDSYNPGSAYDGYQVTVDTTNGLVFVGFANNGVSCFSYTTAGALTLTDTESGVSQNFTGIALDVSRLFLFTGHSVNNGVGLRSYSYTAAGQIGAQIDATAVDLKFYRHLAIDTSKRLIFAAVEEGVDDGGLSSFSYDTSGNISAEDTVNTLEGFVGVAVDTDNSLVFGASDTAGFFVYSYDSSGNFTLVDSDTGITCSGVGLDTRSRVAFVGADGDGFKTYKYTRAGVLTAVDSDDQGGSYDGIAVDNINMLAFACIGAPGVASYTYT